MARPYSSLREPVLDAVRARAPKPATWRDVASDLEQLQIINTLARAELQLVRITVDNMGRAGHLHRAGYVLVPGSRRPMTGWLAPELAPHLTPTHPAAAADGTTRHDTPPAHQPLEAALRGWMGA